MTEQLVSAIYATLDEYGHAVLTTPHMFQVMIAKHNRAGPGELAAVAACVQHGTAMTLWECPMSDPQALSATLAQRAGLPLATARWATDVWSRALNHYRQGQPPPAPALDSLRAMLPADRATSPARLAIAAVLLIALVGGLAGALPGCLTAAGVARDHQQAMRLRQLVEKREPTGMRMTPNGFAGWVGTLGGAGGLIGATLGWVAGGFKNFSTARTLGAAAGATWAFDGVAFGVAYYGLPGALFGGLFTAFTMTALGTLLGAFAAVLLLKPAAWLIWPHF